MVMNGSLIRERYRKIIGSLFRSIHAVRIPRRLVPS